MNLKGPFVLTPAFAARLKARLERLRQQIPLGRMEEPADVVGVVAFLASDDASYVTSSTIVVDGGLLWNYSE